MHSPHPRVLSKDEELGKRDDDFRPKRTSCIGFIDPRRWRKRRVILVSLVLGLLWLVLRSVPADMGTGVGRLVKERGSVTGEPTGAPPRQEEDQEDEDRKKQYYNGPIKFFRLATSLHAISRTMGMRAVNRNVLFAAASLRSVANLMSTACEMARWDRNYVHLALMGRDNMPLEEILEINGVTKEGCQVTFHDARADYSEYSSELRLEIAVAGAMKHVNDFMHPQAIIMDDSVVEEPAFTRAMRAKGKALGRPVIEIPKAGYERFLWITRLDAGSLGSWFKPRIEVLVHAPKGSSGSLVRMLKSFERADYEGLRTPRLTVELPSEIEPFAKRFLRDMRWPLEDEGGSQSGSGLMLRHRIPTEHLSSEQASLRFLESTYPSDGNSHVLVLSAQVELDRQYLHYLHYTVLEHYYSMYSTPQAGNLLGMALGIPQRSLNGSTAFVPPTFSAMRSPGLPMGTKADPDDPAPFLYQAPSAIATLIFGPKWAEFHAYLSNRIVASHSIQVTKSRKLVSETEPAWLEYLLELIRARGWYTLYPAVNFATVHEELTQVPEEFTREVEAGQESTDLLKQNDHPKEEAFLVADAAPVMLKRDEGKLSGAGKPLHEELPFDGDLPELANLPLLSYTGDAINETHLVGQRIAFESYFREHIGGCEAEDAARPRIVRPEIATDLFCLPGVEAEYAETAEDVEASIANILGSLRERPSAPEFAVPPHGLPGLGGSGTATVEEAGAATATAD
ncbi:hypothetical protein B0A48_09772 [Cryoendolithus antarcticus]|uniref:Uncharacterized protein n=1 Tax=Cryoendolithus antarcticus TaxID=1507870 RepID=A0A1V8T2Y7_9PEZI|nr:hypothetical protein B0A48_09772 [Cryoendolithus antarcticus]